MSDRLNIHFASVWKNVSDWSGELELVITNNTGKNLYNPEISFKLGQAFHAVEHTGFSFTQAGNVISGRLKPYLAEIKDKQSKTFSISASFPWGGNKRILPLSFRINGEEIINSGNDNNHNLPDAPLGLTSIGTTTNSVSLKWIPPLDASNIDHYIVFYSFSDRDLYTKYESGTNTTLSNLHSNTTYLITVVSVNIEGDISPHSEAIRVMTKSSESGVTKPDTPKNLSITIISPTSLKLRWEKGNVSQNIVYYEVKYTTELEVKKTQNVTEAFCILTELKPNTLYNFQVSSIDVNGNSSSFSPSVSVKTPSFTSSKVEFAPYIDVTINANWNSVTPIMNEKYVKDAISRGVKKFHLAFLTLDKAANELVWGNSYFPYKTIKPLCDLIHHSGGTPVVSFGGAGGMDPSVNFTMEDLTNLYLKLKEDFGVSNIDFDFETSGFYNYKMAFKAAAEAQKLNSTLRFSLTLPVLRSGLTSEGMAMIRCAHEENLFLYIQIMAMDYGSPISNMGQAAVEASESTVKNLAEIYTDSSINELYTRIGVIPMIGQNDTIGEMFTIEDVKLLSDYAKEKKLSILSIWSLSRDFPGTGDLAICSGNPQQTKDYEYTDTFMTFLC